MSDDTEPPPPPGNDDDGDLGDGAQNVAEEPGDEPGHPLRAADAFPFLPKVIG